MTSMRCKSLLIGAAMVALAGCSKTGYTSRNTAAPGNGAPQTNESARASDDPIQSAESAAPESIARNASIKDRNGKLIRNGSNGWTCLADSPATPGPDPMCADANAMKWADAWINHKPPPQGVVGIMYMLAGGTDFSNTDPYAKQPTAENGWIKTGSHIMVVGSKEVLTGYPSGQNPDTSAPFVMWAGTPYAHLMVPVSKPAG